MPNYFRNPDALVDAVRAVLSGQPVEEKMDPVDPKALKGKHKDRKDKDIDNDGDVDSSDEYLHKRRQAVSKAMKEETDLDEAKFSPKEIKMAIGIASDKRYKGGNMTGAAKAIEKIKPGLSYHPQVRAVLRRQNEDTDDNPANRQHLCAKNVVHENWGEGVCIPTMHADPDAEGNVAWYDIMFEHGIESRVSIDELKVTKAESHMHASKKKKMVEEEDIIQKYRDEVSKLEAKKNKTSYEIGRLKMMKQRLRKIDEETDDNSELEQISESLPVTKEDPLVVIWEKPTSPDYSAQGLMGHMNLSVANSIYRFGTNGVAEKLAKAGTGKRIKVGKIYLEYSEHNKTQMVKESKDEYEDDDDKKGKKKVGKKDEIDTEPNMDDQKMTAEMSDKQMKKREEIVKSMKKKSGDFKKRYGDRAKDVMYATATKMAMKEGFELGIEKSEFIEEVELDEAMDTFTVKYKSRAGKEGQIKIKARDDNEAKAKARRQINNLANINSVVKEETE